ncbi:MAG: glycosyltransferase family 39 protein [Planctomycetota bacterium]|nr:glycosyltransferase family 39 protein [Planctomycetota bacterium]
MEPPQERSLGLEILLFVVLALVVRGYKGFVTPIIAEDGVVYIEQADLLREGKVRESLTGHYPPLYPAAIAVFGGIFSDPVTAGKAVSILFGAIAVVPLILLGRTLLPARAVRGAAVVYVLAPFLLTLSGDVLSESLFLFLVLGSVAGIWIGAGEGKLIPIALAGVAAGLSTLTRPEGILLAPFGLIAIPSLRVRSQRIGTKIAPLAVFLVLALAPLAPYAALLQSETGHLQFTRKGSELLGGLPRYAARKGVALEGYRGLGGEEGISVGEAVTVIGRNRGLFLEKYVHDFALLVVQAFPHAIHPVALGLFLSGLLLRPPSGRKEWLLIFFLVWYVACIAVNYPNPRFLAAMIPPACLWCGIGLDEIARRLERRFANRSHRIWWTLLVIFAAGLGARAFQRERVDKLWMKAAAQAIGVESGSSRICARSRRVAFYANGEHLPWPTGTNAGALFQYCRERRATHLVVRKEPRNAWFFKGERPASLREAHSSEAVVVYALPATDGISPNPDGATGSGH